MSPRKGLVLDANILVRAAFGRRVREILETYEDEVRFYAPDVSFADAEKCIPDISSRRGLDVDLALSVLEQIGGIVERVDRSLYEEYESAARGRVEMRDADLAGCGGGICCSKSPFGPKIGIFSEAELPLGPLIEWNSISKSRSSSPPRLLPHNSEIPSAVRSYEQPLPPSRFMNIREEEHPSAFRQTCVCSP